MTAFQIALAKNIKAKVASLLKEGTVGMSVNNLLMVVPVPPGAPKGTNARFHYRESFREVLNDLPLRGFEIIE